MGVDQELSEHWHNVPEHMKKLCLLAGFKPSKDYKVPPNTSQQTPKKKVKPRRDMKFMIQTEAGRQRYFIEIKEEEYEDLMGLYTRKASHRYGKGR